MVWGMTTFKDLFLKLTQDACPEIEPRWIGVRPWGAVMVVLSVVIKLISVWFSYLFSLSKALLNQVFLFLFCFPVLLSLHVPPIFFPEYEIFKGLVPQCFQSLVTMGYRCAQVHYSVSQHVEFHNEQTNSLSNKTWKQRGICQEDMYLWSNSNIEGCTPMCNSLFNETIVHMQPYNWKFEDKVPGFLHGLNLIWSLA